MNQEVSQINIQAQNEAETEPEYDPEKEPEKEEISVYDWNQMFKKGKIKKEDMDMLVMDFLVNNDLPDVAETFEKESGCPLEIKDLSHFKTQQIVKHLIFERQSDKAINLLNEKLGLSFLKDRPQLHFRLEKQKMIELRYRRDFKGAYAFTPKFLMWAKYDDFKDECLETIHLLFSGNVYANPPSHLMEFMRSYYLVKDILEEMISVQDHEPASMIERAMETLQLVENELNKVVQIPNFNIDSGYPEPIPHQHTGL